MVIETHWSIVYHPSAGYWRQQKTTYSNSSSLVGIVDCCSGARGSGGTPGGGGGRWNDSWIALSWCSDIAVNDAAVANSRYVFSLLLRQSSILDLTLMWSLSHRWRSPTVCYCEAFCYLFCMPDTVNIVNRGFVCALAPYDGHKRAVRKITTSTNQNQSKIPQIGCSPPMLGGDYTVRPLTPDDRPG